MRRLRRWWLERRALRGIPRVTDRVIEGLAGEGRSMIHREAMQLERLIDGMRE